MKITRYRNHKINPSDNKTYESLDIGATVEFDTALDLMPDGSPADDSEAVALFLDALLDEQLAPEVDRVVESGTSISESHIFDYYRID